MVGLALIEGRRKEGREGGREGGRVGWMERIGMFSFFAPCNEEERLERFGYTYVVVLWEGRERDKGGSKEGGISF